MSKEFLFNIIYGLLLIWFIFSIFYIIKLLIKKNTKLYNPYLYNSIPSVFTSIGILGTFGGIYIGLQDFNVNDISGSIYLLLEGMKVAFLTSIIGIILSLIFRIIGQLVLRAVELNSPIRENNEISVLNNIASILSVTKDNSTEQLNKIINSLVGNDDSLSVQLIKIKNQSLESNIKKNKFLENIYSEQISIFNSINEKLSSNNKIIINEIKNINLMQKNNNESLVLKFDEFSEILKKNNTESLVKVMEDVTETFNNQMSKLIEKLVQENFKELNNSVKNLNDWQKENKEIISLLTQQFKDVSGNFKVASSSIQEITNNTTKLTNNNSQLSILVQELQNIFIDDTKLQNIINVLDGTVNKLDGTVNLIKINIESFDETTNKLNSWIVKEHDFKGSIDILITRLNEIEKIKDINGEFWDKTKKQLEEGVSLISNASTDLRNNLDNISSEFTEQLGETLTSLDELIQRLMQDKNNER